MAEGSPTIRQRELGIRLRKFREAEGLTVNEVAERLLCSATKISRAETGARRPTLRDVRDLCEIYHVDPDTSEELMRLARQAREHGWWADFTDLDLEPFIGLEQDAVAITCFGMYFVPALLQTEDYAREIIKAIAPKIDPGVLGHRVEARMLRQRLLEPPDPTRYRALLDEAVLHRQIGGPAVMKAQLDKILELVHEGRATVQVVPFEVGGYAAIDSNFDYLDFAEGSPLAGSVYVEGLVKNSIFDRPAELRRYGEALDYLRDAALSPRDSARRIQEVRDGAARL